jgi:malonyl-ACP decarboxylase
VTGIAITGVGITTSVGQGRAEVTRALLEGRAAFRVMQRPGRQHAASAFLGAEIDALRLPEGVSPKLLRTISWSSQVALATVAEAWIDANLAQMDPKRIGLVIGGSNIQQRELAAIQNAYADRPEYIRPTYAELFMDSDVAAVCSEHLGIQGPAWTVGGASASGHLAIIDAIRLVSSNEADACIAVGALADLSHWECQAFRAVGAMGSDRFSNEPQAACRPFDASTDGFIFGESCGAVVVRRADADVERCYANVLGWSYGSEGRRSPEPSLAGEQRAIRSALQMSGLRPEDVDYVNTHGTGSRIGDSIELQALRSCGIGHAHANATKSILGHGLSAAGAVEVVATLLQMESEVLHPTRNLQDPIDASFPLVQHEPRPHRIRNAINLSFGFGGINSAICLSNPRL